MLNLTLSDAEPISHQADSVAKIAQRVVLGKRLFDLLVATLVLLLIMSWLVPMLSIAIQLTSPGPTLFVQVRTGRNGRRFRCLKFRTMSYDPNAQFKQATQYDCRITRVGAVLRKTNLDELPQMHKVQWGDMSIVGPRPHPLALDAQHWHTLLHYPSRYVIKPGITGLAQVRGYRGETAQLIDMVHRVRLDRLYIQKQSVWLDLKICWWTTTNIIRGDKKAC